MALISATLWGLPLAITSTGCTGAWVPVQAAG
jgi:hypothetical protein